MHAAIESKWTNTITFHVGYWVASKICRVGKRFWERAESELPMDVTNPTNFRRHSVTNLTVSFCLGRKGFFLKIILNYLVFIRKTCNADDYMSTMFCRLPSKDIWMTITWRVLSNHFASIQSETKQKLITRLNKNEEDDSNNSSYSHSHQNVAETDGTQTSVGFSVHGGCSWNIQLINF